MSLQQSRGQSGCTLHTLAKLFKTLKLVAEKFPSVQGNLGHNFSKYSWNSYLVSTNEIAPHCSTV
jgi:hypothetical protein